MIVVGSDVDVDVDVVAPRSVSDSRGNFGCAHLELPVSAKMWEVQGRKRWWEQLFDVGPTTWIG